MRRFGELRQTIDTAPHAQKAALLQKQKEKPAARAWRAVK
jgi:hypothetical protein